MRVRLASLRPGTAGRLYERGHPVDLGAVLDGSAVLEIEDAGDDQDKAFLMGTVLIALAGYLPMRHRAESATAAQLRHLTVVEEAHRLLRNPGQRSGPAAHAMPDGTARETAAPALTASPAAIIGRRSPGCGPACRARPCTLRQLVAARRAAEHDPRITARAELTVLAHLTGRTMPMPALPLAAALAALDTRLRDCALSHAADTAAASRAPVITARVSPPDLAAHVTAAMRAALDHQRWLCDRREPRYLAPCYQRALTLDSLRTWHRASPGAGRHPDTAAWEASCQRVIPGDTGARQITAVQRWHDASQRDQRAVRAVAFGTRTPAAMQQAIGAAPGDDDWKHRLTDTLAAFRDCQWPADYLRPGTTPIPS